MPGPNPQRGVFIVDNEARVDLLHYEAIAKTVLRLVESSGNEPISIGIHGDWGAGKSTVLSLIQAQVNESAKTMNEEEPRPLCLRFNTWQFQGFEDVKMALLEAIITQIRENRSTVAKVKEQVLEALKQVDYLKLAKKSAQWGLTFFTGVPHPEQVTGAISAIKTLLDMGRDKVTSEAIEKSVGEVESLIKPGAGPKVPEHIEAFKKEFHKLIKVAKISKLVVLIDDLDRCLPATVIESMEAIRLFLFTEHTAFVVAADEAMVQYAVKQHFPDLPNSEGPRSYALNYLEKLIQVPFRIPPLGSVETQHYITLALAEAALGTENLAFKKLVEIGRDRMREPWKAGRIENEVLAEILKGELDDSIKQLILRADQLYILLAKGTEGNPRQIKRFLNALLLRREIALARGLEKHIKLPILAKLMLAEYYKDDFYSRLEGLVLNHRDGAPEELAAVESEAKPTAAASPESPAKSGKENAKETEWKKDEWVQEWAATAPALAREDLRPYFFISRDKKVFFPGLELPNRLLATADLLMGQVLGTMKAAVPKLEPKDALHVAAEIRNRILAEGEFDREPRGILGLTTLAERHTQTRVPLLVFFKSLPIDKLGAWAGQVVAKLMKYPETTAEATALAEAWCKENKRIAAFLAASGKSDKT